MKILIIEDEPNAVARLEKNLKRIDKNIHVEAAIDGIESTLLWLTTHPEPDLIFMDIHLSDGLCFEIFDHIEIQCPVIFTTAYDQYALEVFKVHTIDYLLKPIKVEALEKAYAKYQRFGLPKMVKEEHRQISEAMRKEPGLQRLLCKVGSRINLIKMESIGYFYSQNKMTFLITKEGRRFPVERSLESLEKVLDPSLFFRINRKFIIHLDAIAKMTGTTKGRVKVELAPECSIESIVSTERSKHFKKWLIGAEV
ncbi:MAG: LytTR family DNA-binding domain-containing protein [Saprospiraceae bacterium]|nr:LytTR family DNA-binding domain-containing protein [Saprospiraceae bacterium]